MRIALMAGLLMAGGPAAPALAQQPAPVEADLRCIAALSAVTGNLPEGEQRTQVAAGIMYFVGHVEGQAPRVDLTTELKRIVPTLTAQSISEDVKRCGAILIQKGTQLQAIGGELNGKK